MIDVAASNFFMSKTLYVIGKAEDNREATWTLSFELLCLLEIMN